MSTPPSARLGLFAVLAIAAPAAAASKQPPIDLDHVRIVDLTHAFGTDTLYWPTAPSRFELKELHRGRTPAGFFYCAYSFCTPEHGGTHLDAPIHFAADARAADQVPVAQLIAPAVVVDVAAKAQEDADYRLTREDVLAFEKRFGKIGLGTIVLVRTGWSERWPDAKRYLGDDTPGDASKLHFPGYGRDAAELLVRDRRVGALGIDTASLDHGPSQDFVVHQIAAAANVPGLENIARLNEVPAAGAWVIALPMKIAGGSGGPVRIVALVPR
jgi:kynurenine formamidase